MTYVYDDVTYVYDDVTHVCDDVTYVYDDVTYVYDDVTYENLCIQHNTNHHARLPTAFQALVWLHQVRVLCVLFPPALPLCF